MIKTGLGVKGIITKEGKSLVLIKPNGEPDLPGGRVEDAEEYRRALHREIMEETGLKVRILGTLVQWSFMKNPELLVTGVTYYCQYLSGKVRLSDEHSDYFWADFDKTGQFLPLKYFGQSGIDKGKGHKQ
jgi:8-oxo-dGTP diphosphatase